MSLIELNNKHIIGGTMRKVIFGLIFILTFKINAAEPIVELSALPSNNELELYEESEGLFALKILEYYKIAVLYEAQLRLIGLQPANPTSIPTLEELTDADVRTLRRYYNQADGLRRQVIEAPDAPYHKKIVELREKVEKMNNDNFILQEQIHRQNLELLSANYYRNRYREMIAQIDSLRSELDKMFFDCRQQSWVQMEYIRQAYDNWKNSASILSIGLTGNYLSYNDSRIDANISPGIAVVFNPSPIFGMGKILDIWTEYTYQIIEAEKFYQNRRVNMEYKTDYISTGMNLNIPLSEVMKIENFYLGLKGGYGFFWGSCRLPNTELPSKKWQGQTIRMELMATNFSRFHFPVGFFAAYHFNHYSKDLVFPAFGGEINLGRPWTTNFQLGVRFALWQTVSTTIY